MPVVIDWPPWRPFLHGGGRYHFRPGVFLESLVGEKPLLRYSVDHLEMALGLIEGGVHGLVHVAA